MSDQPPILSASAVGTVTKANHYRIVFANHLRMRITNTDLGIAFGFSDATQEGVAITEEFLAIMTPSVAKQLSESLRRSIEVFENTYGKIPSAPQLDPDEFMRQVNAISPTAVPG